MKGIIKQLSIRLALLIIANTVLYMFDMATREGIYGVGIAFVTVDIFAICVGLNTIRLLLKG